MRIESKRLVNGWRIWPKSLVNYIFLKLIYIFENISQKTMSA